MNKIVLGLLCNSLCGLLFATEAYSQIEITPTRVIATMRERSQEVTIINPTDQLVEVSVRSGFKLLTSDSLGQLSYDTSGAGTGSTRSCEKWITIFPRKFMLPPRGTQVVRVVTQPPGIIEDGEYWARAAFTSNLLGSSVGLDVDTALQIQTSVRTQIVIDIPIIFRKGNVTTGIVFDSISALHDGTSTLLLLDLSRIGNGAYRGTLQAKARDKEGNVVAEVATQYTVESNLRQAIRLHNLPPGDYTVDVESISVKKGAANDAVLPAVPVRQSYTLTVGCCGVDVISAL